MTPAQLAADILAAAATAEAEADAAVGRIAGKVAREQQRMSRRVSDRLPETISADRVNMGEWEAGTTMWWAYFPEYGTSTQPPRPFIAPPADQFTDDLVRQIAEAGDF